MRRLNRDETVDTKGQVAINFIILALLRGTTPLMMYLAVTNLDSAPLVVAIKCGITFLLFSISLLWFMSKDTQLQCHVINNLRNKNTYWKLFVIGLCQSAAPYILVIYSLQYLPPTLLGVFLVITPWWTAVIQRIPAFKLTDKIQGMVKIGMAVGFVGILLILAPIIKESTVCDKDTNVSNMSIPENVKTYDGRYDTCVPTGKLIAGLVSLMVAPVLWASATVFWRIQRKDTHYLVSSIGQNLVGGILAILLWSIFRNTDVQREKSPINSAEAIGSLLFLGLATGWLATLLVQHLFTAVGAKTTNQVLTTIPFISFLEDCVFVRDVVIAAPWVIALEVTGLLLVSAGVFISNLSINDPPKAKPQANQRPFHTSSESLNEPLLNSDEHPSPSHSDSNNEITNEGLYTVPSLERIQDIDNLNRVRDIPSVNQESEHPPITQVT